MLNQSIGYLALHIGNLVLGLFITIYVAAKIQPEVYATLTIYMIVTSIMSAFSHLGYETILIRNALCWEATNQRRKIVDYVTYALVGRVILSAILSIPIYYYLYHLLNKNNNEANSIMLYGFMVAGLFSSLLNSTCLIIKAFNKYILASIITIVGSLIGKLIAFCLFLSYGFNGYVYTVAVTPIILFVVSLLFIRQYVDFRVLKVKNLFKISESKFFIASGYMKYLVGYSDRVIVSVFLPIEILASFSLGKQVQEIAKSLIEGFFDPLTQRAVKFKNSKDSFYEYLNKVKKIWIFIFSLSALMAILIVVFSREIVELGGLNKYMYLDTFIAFAVISSLVHLYYKLDLNYTSLLVDSGRLFYFDIYSLACTLIYFTIICNFLEVRYIYLSRILTEVSIMIAAIQLFKRMKSEQSFDSNV